MLVADPHRTTLYHPERSGHRVAGGRPQSPHLTHNFPDAGDCLAILRGSSLTLAMNSLAGALSRVASKSFARRRLRLSQATVRSTTHHRGSGSKPLAALDRWIA
jgi:hypothetical protein